MLLKEALLVVDLRFCGEAEVFVSCTAGEPTFLASFPSSEA